MDLVGSDHCEDQNPDVDISTSSNRMSEPAEIIIEYEHTFTSTDAKIGHSTPKRKRNESMSAAVRDGGLKRLTSPQSDNCDVLSISSTTVTASECNISNNSDTVLARNDSSITLSASSLSATVTASSDDVPRELPSISGKMTRHRQIMQQRSKMHKHVWNISGKTVGSAEKTIASLKKKIKNLHQQNRRLKSKKVYSQQSLMEYLRETCGLTPNAGLVLNVEAVHPLWFDKMWMHYASLRWPDSKDLHSAIIRLVCQSTDLMHDAEHSTNCDMNICWDDNEVERIRRLIRKYEEGQKLCAQYLQEDCTVEQSCSDMINYNLRSFLCEIARYLPPEIILKYNLEYED
ncbi:unnamed protein product [Acanthoscelides obtectus]|uniref:Uncharacterized protein n=1 Tax=Acanthoscelides obtectus TaxID=200917 RepID=A0A9P0KYW3_ACAOB|nr:unnamed protein product [Acanthoscelides obtectus]CAK1656070.1 hypothetical protein AOBTE_LOCUS19559 [Acanthoscelides obtectus]